MDGLLKGRVALITGAAREQGIGKATAKLFVEHGAKVALLDMAAEDPEAAAQDLGEDNAMGVVCDVTDKDGCFAAADAVAGRWGRIDVLVNNAGLTQRRRFDEISLEDFELVTGVVLRGTMLMSQAVLPHMTEKGGAIVNVSSLSALQGGGIFGGPHYCAAKAGVLGLTRSMAKQLGPDGIRANAIAPGLIMTDFSRRGSSADAEKIEAGKAYPLGRVGLPLDIAKAALFLASDLSDYITGVTLNVNGGSFIA